MRLARRAPTLAVIAGAAGSDEVLPLVRPAAMARHHMVERQFDAVLPAVLTALLVAREHFFACQAHAWPWPPHRLVQTDDGWQRIGSLDAEDQVVRSVDDLGLAVV